MDTRLILIIITVAAAIASYVFVRERMNLRKAANGEDKERLRKAVAQVLPGESGYQIAYGHYENVQHYGRKTLTTYYFYALAFDASRIWVMPLLFDKDLIVSGEPVQITDDMLGVVDVNITNGKEGKARRIECSLYDKNGESFLDCVVEVKNTRKDSYHHLNLIQEEECARFGGLISSIASRVNRDNAGLQAQVHATCAGTRKAWVYGISGAVFGIFFSPFGLILSIIGLRHAKKSRFGNKLTAPLVTCSVALAISSVFTLLECVILIYYTLL